MSSKKSLNRNGYGPSLFPEIEETEYTVRHEVFGGYANRKLSKEWGCWLPVSTDRHWQLHQDKEEADKLKAECQKRFEARYSHGTFMSIFGRNYI